MEISATRQGVFHSAELAQHEYNLGAMPTLLLSMPKDKNFATGLHQPISTIFSSGTGPDYVLFFSDISRITRE
jgi:hypothetical protein